MDSADHVNQPSYWEHIYLNERPRWDIGHGTPVFANWLRDRNTLGTGLLAVLGCGNGHDALLFAEHAFEVTAVDFAAPPLAALQRAAAERNLPVSLLQEDIFKLPRLHRGRFDFVLEYTSFCAIDPARRDEYVRAIHEILKPGGHLIALFFPIDDRTGGPPFPMRHDEIDQRFFPYFSPILDEAPSDSVPKRLGKERFVIFQKK